MQRFCCHWIDQGSADMGTCEAILSSSCHHIMSLWNLGPLGKPRNHAAYAASLQEPTPTRSRTVSAGARPHAPRAGDAPAAAYSRPPARSAPSAVPQSARMQQQQPQPQRQARQGGSELQGVSRPSEVTEEGASAAAFPVPQHRLARSAGPAKPAKADNERSGSGLAVRKKSPS
eukprot:1151777-Pelagomonas_calceolata.AAC.3